MLTIMTEVAKAGGQATRYQGGGPALDLQPAMAAAHPR
jgi:hypothetical protein